MSISVRRFPTVLVSFLLVPLFATAPALAATPETPETFAATAVTGNSAVLRGELNPHAAGEPGEYQFYFKPSTEACRPGADTAPEPAGVSAGAEKEVVEVEATNLEPNQTYAFCLIADPESAFIEGPSVTFKTLATAKPLVYKGTTSATQVGAFSATLDAKINPENEKATYAFEYATNAAFTGAKTIPGMGTLEPPVGFTEPVPASLPTGNVLAPETTYYFRILATDGAGTTAGPVETLTTQPAAEPAVIGEGLAAQNSFEPKLEAHLNPSYEETTYSFEYSTQATGEVLEGTIHTLPGAPPAASLPAVFEEEPGLLAGPVGLTGLQGGTTYYYRVVANDKTSEEAQAPVYGPVQSFQADAAPLVSAEPAGAPTRMSATVSGSVNPLGLASRYHFAYVPLSQYEAGAANPFVRGRETYDTRLVEEYGESLEDYVAQPVELALEELAPGTTYVYALVAHNELGTTTGVPQTFTTAPAPAPGGPVAVEAAVAPLVHGFAPAAVFPSLSHGSIAQLNAIEAKEGKASTPKALTRAQKLAKALKTCRAKRAKQRTSCEATARKRYGSKKSTTKKQ